uniref:NADH-ubiquinone oxidoreductase chain 6 n=1 Tax=Cysteochila chiniana TaxID=2172476 RepID=A0A343WNM0_9HEMI|nr:NADH dehydrogenase subunit 6 [Cysteochila chiniana]AWD31596.1 NADH dehydrogenase subunit 6 [Cysteochila chiniana]
MNMLIILFLITSFTFMFSITPLSMGVTLIMQTFMISMMTAMMISSFWYSYLLILVMVSGLLVMFMYMASIASNEKFKISFNWMPFTIMFLYILTNETLIYNKKINMEKLTNSQELIMNKLLNSKFIIPSLLMIMFLFLVMIAISFLVNTEEGPMRKSY